MNTYSIVFLSVAVIYIIMGYILKLKPPKKLNWFYGYRVGKAMKSQKAWDLAQAYSANHMIKQGFVFLALGLFAFLIPVSDKKWAIALEVMLPIAFVLIGVGIMIYKTDKYLEANL